MQTEPHLTALSSFEIRQYMRDEGWDSEDVLRTTGWVNGYLYSIWFRRWDWHGRHTLGLTGHEVCFHMHTNDLNEVVSIVRACAEQALQAYREYTDCIPFQNANNETDTDIMLGDWNDPKVLIENRS